MGGIENIISLPCTALVIAVLVIVANITGINPPTVYSNITTSIAKITPAIGVLNDAAMAAAMPQPTSRRILLLGSISFCPSKLLAAAPR